MPSQFGQDLLVVRLLGGMRGGFFLDSGASDGVSASNTHLLEASYGWNGICVEPNAMFFARLVQNRCAYCVNCCLYDREEEVGFVESASTLGGILTEYDPSLLRHAKSVFRLPVDEAGRPATVQKPARTVSSVLRQFNAPAVIDYWSLDTEGSELTILTSFPFDEYAFRVLTVEHNRLPIRESIKDFLECRGYRRLGAIEIDDCYVNEALLGSVYSSWRSAAWRRRVTSRALLRA
jgi:FkbM family methyltransferase